MNQFEELKLRLQNEITPERTAQIEEIERKEKEDERIRFEARERERKKRYFDSLPLRFKNASFENFIIRKDGGLQKEKCAIETLRGGLLYGTNGNGKTHLGYSACRRVVENGGSAKLIRAFNFFTEIKECYSSKDSVNSVIEKYAKYNYLALDECDKTRGSKDEYINLIELINRRYDSMKPTLIISNHSSIEEIEEVLTPSCTDKIKEGGEINMTYGSVRNPKIQEVLKNQQRALK